MLADNAGLDSGELVTRLRAAHANGFVAQMYVILVAVRLLCFCRRDNRAGLDLDAGTVTDVAALGVVESFKAKSAGFVMHDSCSIDFI